MDGTHQKLVEKFCADDFLLDDAPLSGGPAEVVSGQIETLMENNQHYTMQEIGDILKMSKSIKLLVKMKNVSSILKEKKKTHRYFWPTKYILAKNNTS